jgi:type II secretory pathway pseudopilin PulG
MRPTLRIRNKELGATAPRNRSRQGAVLLEVILALTLFAFAAGILSSSLSSAVQRTLRLHDQTHALDLAASVLAELELGIRAPQNSGPEPFEAPFETWTWQIESTPSTFGTGDLSPLAQVTVIIRHTASSTVQRLTGILPPSDPSTNPGDPLAPQTPSPSPRTPGDIP